MAAFLLAMTAPGCLASNARAQPKAPARDTGSTCLPRGPRALDYSVRPLARVTLPAKGESFVDPTFGTTIIRVTDPSDAGPSFHAYSYISAFNADSTRFVIAKGGVPTLFSFDPATDRLAELERLFPDKVCGWEDAVFSHGDPFVLYCHSQSPKRLYAYDLVTRRARLLHDFDADLSHPGDATLHQLTVDGADDVFSLHTRDRGGRPMHAVVLVNSTGRVYTRDVSDRALARSAGHPENGDATEGRAARPAPPLALDETQVDRTGRFVAIMLGARWDVWEPRTGRVVSVARDSAQRGGLCHQAAGAGVMVGGDCWETGFLWRRLETPRRFRHLARFLRDGGSPNWRYDLHASQNQRDHRYFVASLYTPATTRAPDAWDPWEGEILAVATDGSWVTRLAQHHSVVPAGGYWQQPRASISYDGRYVMFTSDFDGAGRTDVFILKMPPACR